MLLEAQDLTKTFRRPSLLSKRAPVPAVRGVSIAVDRGESVAVVGESGAGKSTLGRLLLRLIDPDGGTLRFDGVDLMSLGRRELRGMRARMQMVFQDPYSTLNPIMTIGDSIAEPLRVHGDLTAAERYRLVLALLERIGLTESHYDRFPREMSGGQLQRVCIARAISVEPDLVVCDEPTSGLDVSIRGQILNLLKDLQRERRLAYVFISHDLSTVRHFAQRILVMYAGLVVETGPTAQIFAQPRHPYTRALLASVPVVDPRRRTTAGRVIPRSELLPTALVAQGCPFQPRCPEALDVCARVDPLPVREGAVHVSCHLYGSDPYGVATPADEIRPSAH